MECAKEASLIFKCIDGNELIQTNKGLLTIRDAYETIKRTNPGLFVLSDSSVEKATAVINNGIKDVFEVSTEFGNSILATGEHRIVACNDGKLMWKKISDVKVGDWVPLRLGKWIVKGDFRFDDFNYKPKTHVELGQFPEKEITIPKVMNEDFATLLGIYIGDGSNHRDGIRFLSGSKDKELITVTVKLIKKVFKRKALVVRNRSESYEVSVLSVKLKRFFKYYGMLKKSSREAFIPKPVLMSSERIVTAFLRGLFSADGSISHGKYIMLTTSSKRLAREVMSVLWNIGIPCKLNVTKNAFVLRIYGRIGTIRFKEKVGFIIKKKQKILNSIDVNKIYTRGEKVPIAIPYLRYMYTRCEGKVKDLIKFALTDIPGKATIKRIAKIYNHTPKELRKVLEDVNTIFTRISNIRYVGKRRVYDLHIPTTHVYLVNGFITHNSGGGIGVNYSKLRPEGDVVASTGGVSSGPVSFMRIIDVVTDVVKAGGKRRGACMGILEIWHPDIEKFISAKEKEGVLSNFNISIAITPDFWKYYEGNKDYPLRNPRDGKIWKTVNARYLLESAAMMAWKSGDPGVIFLDNLNKRN
ncbi:MAG TPA: hypothetical protein ENG45_00760, partial [Candidatus Aenigmarchaeota archaeon]|nr:hypothetical protein [Candidatus Aenigmarchaeota archaeon]